MKKITFLFLLVSSILNVIGQTPLIEYDNDVNTQYKIRCTWEVNGVTYSTGYPGYEMIQGNSTGQIIVVQSNAILISFSIQVADCPAPWINFTAGTPKQKSIGDCGKCSNGEASVGYDGTNPPATGWVGIKCK